MVDVRRPDGDRRPSTRYVLLHLTNSDDGRDLMKECAWSVSPSGEFFVRRSDNPDQQFLIKPESDLQAAEQAKKKLQQKLHRLDEAFLFER